MSVTPKLLNGPTTSDFLMLQSKPIGEPVAQHGPFVMNTEQTLKQAYADYQRTQFGGWPFPDRAPVHGGQPERLARHADVGSSGDQLTPQPEGRGGSWHGIARAERCRAASASQHPGPQIDSEIETRREPHS